MPNTPPGDALAAFRAERHVTQAEFARLIGCSQSRLSHLECGRAVPQLHEAVAVERETNGAVPASAWAESAAKASARRKRRLKRARRRPEAAE